MKLRIFLLCFTVLIIVGCQQTENQNQTIVMLEEVVATTNETQNSITEDEERTQPNILYNNIYEDEFGDKWYFEEGTYDLVKSDKDMNKLDRFSIENSDILYCLQTQQHNEFWIVKDGYLLIDNNEDWFYYMNLESRQINRIDLMNGYIEYSNFEARWINNGDRIFCTSEERFINDYSKKIPLYDVSYFEYEGKAYYEDNPEISLGVDENIENRKDILPVSESPQFFYDGKQITISDSKKLAGTIYYQMAETGWIGIIGDKIFEPIIEKDVRDYLISDYGVIYIEYNDRSNIITLQQEELKVEFKESLPIDSIAVQGKWLYYILDSKRLKRIDMSSLISNKSEDVLAEELFDLEELAGDSLRDSYNQRFNFKLESNNDYLLVYDEYHYKILVFNSELKIMNVLNSSFIHLTDDNKIIMNVLAFLTRHDIEKDEDEILGEYYFVSRDLIFNNYLIYCTPYEGPGLTKCIDIYAEAINPFMSYTDYEEDIDYSIEIGISYEVYIIVYDHINKKIELFDIVSTNPEYKLTEDGLKYWIDINETNDNGFIPLRNGSKVQVYWTKRT